MIIEKDEVKKSFLTKQNHRQDKKINIPVFELPKIDDVAMDSFDNVHFKHPNYYKGVNPLQLEWFANHSFIGYQACVYIANHWLVNKSCLIPARDSIGQGWEIDTEDTTKEIFKKIDKKFKIKGLLRDFIYMGKIFGGQLAFF